MTRLSRSVRHRYARRGLPVPETPTTVHVHIELRDVNGVSRTFLILPGQRHDTRIEGYRTSFGSMERITLPITITANIV